ncbi:MAG: PstS family phosphate ABC transporter substrate-binding protein [Syntrophobacteraceae bacterium]
MKRAPVFFLAAVCAFLITAADVGFTADKVVVRVTGADSMFGRLHTLSQLFEKENPTIDVKITRGETVDAGFAALVKGVTDVAMVSRRISDQEGDAAKAKGIELVENLIGHGGIVIVTHSSNPLNDLTVEQVQKLLRGDCVNWKEFGGRDEQVKVFGIGPKHPGTVVFIREDFLAKSPFCSQAEITPDFPSMLARVAATPGGVGFVRIRDALEYPGPKGCKIVKIKKGLDSESVMPCRATVSDGTYPIRRPYYLYFNGKAPDEVRKYVAFVVAKGWGQQNL